MATITVYTFEDEQGAEQVFTTQNPIEAREHGKLYGYKVMANEFEFSDSEVAWDFTGQT
jgi:hypothetical protein